MTLAEASRIVLRDHPGVMANYQRSFPAIAQQGEMAVLMHWAQGLGNRTQADQVQAIMRAAMKQKGVDWAVSQKGGYHV